MTALFKKVAVSTAVLAAMCAPFYSFAQAVDTQALIAQLQQQISQLQSQLQQLISQQSSPTGEWPGCYTFTTNLGFANSGSPDVWRLHDVLGFEGISYVPDAGYTYAAGTASGVAAFQAKYGIPQTGYFGPIARAKANQLYGCSSSQPGYGTQAVISLDPGTPSGQEIWNPNPDATNLNAKQPVVIFKISNPTASDIIITRLKLNEIGSWNAPNYVGVLTASNGSAGSFSYGTRNSSSNTLSFSGEALRVPAGQSISVSISIFIGNLPPTDATFGLSLPSPYQIEAVNDSDGTPAAIGGSFPVIGNLLKIKGLVSDIRPVDIVDVSYVPASPKVGDQVTAYVTVKNINSSDIPFLPHPFVVNVGNVSSQGVSSLDAGAQTVIAIPQAFTSSTPGIMSIDSSIIYRDTTDLNPVGDIFSNTITFIPSGSGSQPLPSTVSITSLSVTNNIINLKFSATGSSPVYIGFDAPSFVNGCPWGSSFTPAQGAAGISLQPMGYQCPGSSYKITPGTYTMVIGRTFPGDYVRSDSFALSADQAILPQPSLKILTPNGGETWMKDNNPKTITWTTANIPNSALGSPIVITLQDGAGKVYDITGGKPVGMAPNANGTWNFILPANIPAGSYKVLATITVDGKTFSDSSDNLFTIAGPTSTVSITALSVSNNVISLKFSATGNDPVAVGFENPGFSGGCFWGNFTPAQGAAGISLNLLNYQCPGYSYKITPGTYTLVAGRAFPGDYVRSSAFAVK